MNLPKQRLCRIGIAITCLCALPLGVAAPDSPSTAPETTSTAELPEPLTLDAAVRQALRYNYAVQSAKARVGEKVGERIHDSRWFPSNPTLELETADRSNPRTGESSRDVGIRIAQELWTGGKGDLHEAAARARETAAGRRLDFLVTSTAARTRQAFLRVLLAREAVDTARRALEIARRIAGYAERRLEAGEANRMTLNSAQIGRGRAATTLATARHKLATARLDLAELLSVDPADSMEVAGQLVVPKLEIPDRSALLRDSLKRRSDLLAAASEVAGAREELQLSQRQLIPNLKLFGFYKEEEGSEVTGVGMSVPLPVAHQYSGEEKAAQARLRAAHINKSAVRLAVRKQVLNGLSAYRSARQQLDATGEQMVASAEQNVTLTHKAFKTGKVGIQAVATAQATLLDTRDAYLGALRSLIDAATNLERATGGLIAVTENTKPAAEGARKEDKR